jgi:PTH1 family peptidyl-tRNA hydrolase
MRWTKSFVERFKTRMVDKDELQESDKFLIVGLGNPGRKYQNNRHNIGFMVVNRLSERSGIPISRIQQKSIIGDGRINGSRVFLVKPQTFMNRSGESIAALSRYFKVPLPKLLVIYDEIDLPLATLRLRERGGSGGHNGMKSIIQQIGQDFPRLRIGVGRPPGRMEPADYVLRDFGSSEIEIVEGMIESASEAVETFILYGLEVAMTRFNGPVEGVV